MTEPRSDESLWAALCGGDVEVFDVLYDRHAPGIHRFLCRRVGAQDAEDLTATVFTEAWAQRHRVVVDPQRGMGPWLVTIAANLARRHLADQHRSNRTVRRLAGTTSEQPDHADDVAASLDDLQDLRRARAALARLPDPDQEVLVLCVLEGMTSAHAGTILGQGASTVRSRLTRSRRRLAATFTTLTLRDEPREVTDEPAGR